MAFVLPLTGKPGILLDCIEQANSRQVYLVSKSFYKGQRGHLRDIPAEEPRDLLASVLGSRKKEAMFLCFLAACLI